MIKGRREPRILEVDEQTQGVIEPVPVDELPQEGRFSERRTPWTTIAMSDRNSRERGTDRRRSPPPNGEVTLRAALRERHRRFG